MHNDFNPNKIQSRASWFKNADCIFKVNAHFG